MFFWKIDDETIRCLINKEEIGQMGFDLKELGEDNELMEYREWGAELYCQSTTIRTVSDYN